MKKPFSGAVILVAEDDPDDQELLSEAFAQVTGCVDLRFVDSGLDLLNYLAHEPPYQASHDHPDPRLILLDLNMPGVDGREALRRLRDDGRWRRIPVVVFTTSSSQEDIDQVYALGGNSYITKPERMDDLVHLVHTLERYWLDTVQLPS
jgi:two-component system, response regulator